MTTLFGERDYLDLPSGDSVTIVGPTGATIERRVCAVAAFSRRIWLTAWDASLPRISQREIWETPSFVVGDELSHE